MGKIDTRIKAYLRDRVVFADAFNYFVFDGEQVLKAENLQPWDTDEIGLPYGKETDAEAKTTAKETVQKYRDSLNYATIMSDDETAYVLLGIEGQFKVHYAMPVRNMEYDALQYAKQVEEIARKHREERDYKGRDSGEYLSGFYREDKVIPVITLVLYLSPDPWDGPRSIHEMLAVKNPEILSFVQDYRLHLIEPAGIPKEDLGKFVSNLKQVIGYIKYSRDSKKLVELVESDPAFHVMDRDVAILINECTNSNIKIDRKEQVIDMCQAIEDIRMEGMKEGREETILDGVRNLGKSFGLTAAQALKALGIPEKEHEALLKKL